jgi:PilZ domain
VDPACAKEAERDYMLDRRKFRRRYLAFYSRVFDVKSHQLLGRLVDLTPQGLMLLSEIPLPTATAFRLKIELSEAFTDKTAVVFGASSIWCQPDIDPHFYNTGFHLTDIDPEDVTIIESIVRAYGFRDN